jgi:molybdenum cofactor cytidylyltransferase
MSDSACAAIILAAGASTRLGQPKQLLRIHGESLLHRTARLVLEAGCSPVITVLGYEAERMQQELANLKAIPVINPDWRSGMGSSLRRGIQALLQQNPVPDRVLLLLTDQPRLSAEVLTSILKQSASEDAWITASTYAGRQGVPAVFRKPLYAALQGVKGDIGARQIIQQYQDHATLIDFPEGAIDIDTIDDLKAISPK